MRCIFCKKNSSNSKSEEHIVPESLGNKSHVLPPGVVCDRCNNYFSIKVEKPFMESKAIVHLRHHENLFSKKNRTPKMNVLLSRGIVGDLHKEVRNGEEIMMLGIPPEKADEILKMERGSMFVVGPPSHEAFPKGHITSRFLAKLALEFLAQTLMESSDGIDYLIEETAFDPLREHARMGKTKDWPYNVRRIYESDEITFQKEEEQIVHESDFFQTEQGELYFIFAFFGIEFTINVGGPSVEGYLRWLEEHDQISPLYWGKNKIETD